MPWPQSQDYNEAIQNPQSSFGDPELRGGQAVTNAMGMPMPRSGNFADVYEFIGASGQKWAIKCFTRQIPGLQERYGVISKSLAQAKLPFMVDFDYLAKGIRIRGEFFPVLKMHWVEGFLLNEFVRNNLDKPSLLDALGQVWLRMAIALRRAGFAHADLQHGNVILIPGSKAASLSVRLIDYDGMWVPALAGKKSGEVGHANYQHPERLKSGIYSIEVDRFPHLVIYTALRGLMVGGPELWNKYDNGDNLLFKQADLDAPSQSPLFAELLRVNNPEVRKLTEILARAVEQPLERTPFLDGLAAAAPAARSTGRKSEVVVEPRPQAESVFASITAATSVRGPARSAKKAKVRMMVGGGLALIGLIGLAIVGIILATGGRGKEDASQHAAVQPPEPPKQVEIGASSKKELNLPKDQEAKKDAAAKKDREPTPPVKVTKDSVRPAEKLDGPGKEKTKPPDGAAEKPQPPKKEAKNNDAPAPKIQNPNKKKVDLPVRPKVVTNGKKWDHLDLSEVQVVGDYLRLQGELRTKDKLSGELDITVVARTADKEIRLDAYNGACVIFNWEKNPNELRVNRPDGDVNKHESGTLATARVKPLAPNTWYSLRWQVTSTGMKVFVNGKMVFSDSRKYDLSTKAPVVVRRLEWDVDVKMFAVKEFGKDQVAVTGSAPFRITSALVNDKFYGRAAYDPRTGTLTLVYDFKSPIQLRDFELGNAKPSLQNGFLVLRPGTSVKHIVKFKEVTVSGWMSVKTMRGSVLIATDGTSVGFGGANPDTIYLDSGPNHGESIVPPEHRTGIIPMTLTILPSVHVQFDYGSHHLITFENEVARAGFIELHGGDVGYGFGQMVFSGKLNEEWAKQFFAGNLPQRNVVTVQRILGKRRAAAVAGS